MSDGIIEYCMDSSFFRSAHIKFGDLYFNLLAVDNRDTVRLEKAMCIAFQPEICTAFLIASVQASYLVFVPLNVSITVMAACNIVCSTIAEATELPSKVVGPEFCDSCQLFSLLLCV